MCLTIAYDTNISMAKLVPTGMVSCFKLVQDSSLVLLSHKFCLLMPYLCYTAPPPSSLTPLLPPSVWASQIGFQDNVELVFQIFFFTVLAGN